MVKLHGLEVADLLFAFVEHEALPGTGLSTDAFWRGAAAMIGDLSPRVRAALDRRSELQQWMETHGVDTRMVWTGNVTRQPMMRDATYRVPDGGLPNADRVMEWGLILPNNHSLTDDDCNYIGETTEAFLTEKGLI